MEKPTSLRSIQQELGRRFSEKYGENEGNAIARLLVEFYTGKNLNQVLDTGAVLLSPEEKSNLEAATEKILVGIPVQYVTGEAHFYGREFWVNPAVLIPRGETESLVQSILTYTKSHTAPPIHMLDIGTGSGCIPITLALELDLEANIQGIDISPEALEVAQQNAQRLGANISFKEMDILTAPADAFSDLDVIVSNPPYVTEADRVEMQAHVLDHEPHLALFPEGDGPLIFYRKIAALGTHWLRPGGALFVEINEAFGKEVVEIFSGFGYRNCEILQDIHGKDRVVVGEN